MMNEISGWYRIRDFLFGPGFRKVNDVNEKVIFVYDAKRFLNIDIWNKSESELDAIYEQILPLKEAEIERRRKEPRPAYKRIAVPNVNRVYPPL